MVEPTDERPSQPEDDPKTEILDPPTRILNAPPSAPAGVSTAPPSRVIGDYRIIRKLGQGGMGVVYEAEQQHPRRPVALKIIRGGLYDDEYRVKLFEREVQVLARLIHPGIAAIYGSGSTPDGQHFFAMELVRGVSLLDYVKGRRLGGTQAPTEIRQRVEIFLRLCEAISYAHQRGVIHRDLKPANILVSDNPDGGAGGGSMLSHVEVKVLDFGLARITDADVAGATGLSEVGQIKGTLAYMSPEQIRGRTDGIDVRTDVYALGVILYEMLTECLPYEVHSSSIPEAIRVVCEETPRPPSRVSGKSLSRANTRAHRIDRDIGTIALKALEKDPARRYQSVAAVAEDVARYLRSEPITARPPSSFYQFRKLVARHKLPFASLAAVFVLLLGFAVTMAAQATRIARERDRSVAAERLAAEQRDEAEQARKIADEARNSAEQARSAEREQRDAAEQARNAAEEARVAEQGQRLMAEANFRRAEEQKALAEEQRALAEQRETSNRRLLYTAHMNLASQAWEQADVERVEELLEQHKPGAGQEDMRGFEWYYLWWVSHAGLITLKGHTDGIVSVAFSPDGTRLATASADRTAKLWDVVTGQELTTLKGHASYLRSVAFSPDGKLLATASGDRTVKLWDAPRQ